MFFFKKIIESAKKNGIPDKNSTGSIQSDAFPIKEDQNLERNTSCSSEVSNIPSIAENGMNVNNVNQQVVVQFSNIRGLQIGSTYNINNGVNVHNTKHEMSQYKIKHKYPKTVTINAMMKCNKEPNREILNEIATHLGLDYKNFMRELGFSDGQISAKNIDHNMYGVREVIYQLLLDWIRNADGDGTVGYLTTKLWNSGHHECVYRLKSMWKSNGFPKMYDADDSTI